MAKRKEFTLKSFFRRIYVAFSILAVIGVLAVITIGIIYLVNRNNGLLIALAILYPITAIIIFAFIITLFVYVYRILYQKIYSVTLQNYENLREDRRNLTKYKFNQITEFINLNNKLVELEEHFANSSIITDKIDFTNIPLEYYDKERMFINEKTFKKYIREIIYCTNSFRNAVISINYENNFELDAASIKEINDMVLKTFGRNNVLFVLKEQENGFFIYIPKIDSITYLKEELNQIFLNTIITRKSINGVDLIPPKISIVIYPYSYIEDIFSDLRYADMQTEDIYVYIPKHLDSSGNTHLVNSATNTNNISKIIESMSSFNEGLNNFDDFLKKCNTSFKEIIQYYNFEQAGIILYDKERKRSGGSCAITLTESIAPLFPIQKRASNELIDAVINSLDKDRSFYFSSRKKVNGDLGKQLDIYGIKSGFFYGIFDVENNFVGLVYFINTKQEQISIDSYLLEALLIVSNFFGVYIKNSLNYDELDDMRTREYNLLKMTNMRTYTIDKSTYQFIKFSPTLKEDFPNIEKGKYCYKELFGYDKPCAHCPLITKQKAIKQFKDGKFEVSYSINTKSSQYVELIMNKLNESSSNSEVHNRFDPDFLINSYYSFKTRLDNMYLTHTKGYIVLLKVDNISELVEQLGNEGYSFLVRCFTREVNSRVLKNGEIYLYKDDTFALVFPEFGKLDVVDAIEKIYEYTKKNYLKLEHNSNFEITYEAVKFPQEFNTPEDLIRHLENVTQEYERIGTDMLYIEENEFTRPASREQYILSIINQATITKNFIIRAQPVLKCGERTIYGAEILSRLSDEYRSSLLNTEEMIAVAAKNNKLNNLSDMLIDYVGDLVKQFGSSTFKTSGITRMSINADYNYFKEGALRSKIIESINRYHFPKNFLTFEITENDFASHYEEMKDIIKELNANDINIVMDHYTGESLSFDKVKSLGCNEIKIDRRIVNDIDVNTDKFEQVKSLMLNAKANDIKLTAVGVENGQIYNLIRGVDPTCSVQGYYFHHPLDQNELIEAIRVNG